jgi:hypothetical protein
MKKSLLGRIIPGFYFYLHTIVGNEEYLLDMNHA